MRELIRPARLAPGARVAVVAPSGPVSEERLQAGLDVLRGWDLDPVVAPHVLDRHGWAGCDPYDEVRAVLADRLGGLGVPVAEEFGFGHCEGALTVPFGVAAELHADAGTLTLDEPALR